MFGPRDDRNAITHHTLGASILATLIFALLLLPRSIILLDLACLPLVVLELQRGTLVISCTNQRCIALASHAGYTKVNAKKPKILTHSDDL